MQKCLLIVLFHMFNFLGLLFFPFLVLRVTVSEWKG